MDNGRDYSAQSLTGSCIHCHPKCTASEPQMHGHGMFSLLLCMSCIHSLKSEDFEEIGLNHLAQEISLVLALSRGEGFPCSQRLSLTFKMDLHQRLKLLGL